MENKENKNQLVNFGSQNQVVDFKSSGNSLATLIKNLPDEKKQALAEFAVEKQLELEADGAKVRQKQAQAYQAIQLQTYQYEQLRKIDARGGNPFTSHTVDQTIDTGTGEMRVTSKSGACFVATATYRNPNHPDVEYLRRFRDTYLKKSKLGKRFVRWYYSPDGGPMLARVVEKHEALRKISLGSLKMLVAIFRKAFPC